MGANALQTHVASTTVGELISELCRWPDHAAVKFRCPRAQAELCFSRIDALSPGVIEVELDVLPETLAAAPSEANAGLLALRQDGQNGPIVRK